MQGHKLGNSSFEVPKLCLGSMTWGSQNTESEGHRQIDLALDHGLNFIDTAEMYPVNPVSADTYGHTESIIGTWNAKFGKRDQVIIASKIAGEGLGFIRGGTAIDRAGIFAAVEDSLQRLQTDYIDLFQVHWPNRGSYHFRKYWDFDARGQDVTATIAHIDEALDAFDTLIQAGKIRHIGLSNESAWGTAKWLERARINNNTAMISIQNEYSLLCRIFDNDLGELCVNEGVGLLAYSPLACGLLTGKYNGDQTPVPSRRALNNNLNQRVTSNMWAALSAYQLLADEHGLDLAQMSLAWAMQRPFMGSVIFGATSEAQLKNSLKADQLVLDPTLISAIDQLHRQQPMPF